MMQLSPCVAVADSLRTAHTARIAAGPYTLVVVSHQGRAQGTLELRRAADRTGPVVAEDDLDAEDGGGIGLQVRQINGAGFAATRGPWGIVQTGTGHFCAFRALNPSP